MLPWIREQHISSKTVTRQAVLLVAVFLFLFFLFSPSFAFAQGAAPAPLPGGATNVFGLDQVAPATGLGGEDIRLIVAKIIRIVLGLLGIIAIVIVLYAGFTIMTAAGNEEKITTGKRILVNGVIGLAIILSSFAIVQFVITRLAAATGYLVPGSASLTPPSQQTFAGSGALGRIVKDHYPFRDQRDVARNISLTVSFREAIDPASLITNTNGTTGPSGAPILGDCINMGQPNFRWDTDCDRLITTAVRITQVTTSIANATPLDMAVLAMPEGPNNEYLTFSFKPLAFLGSDSQPVMHQVDLTANVLKADGRTSAFVNDRNGQYVWQFETSMVLDTDPPKVIGVYPSPQDRIARNSIIQVYFDEPVKPTAVNGLAQNASFYNIIFGDQTVSGEWRIASGYQTVEFVPDQACGANSCGDPMYCLPVTCPASNPACTSQGYSVLVRTGSLLNPSSNSFEAIPFSGVADMAENALDGDSDGISDGKPPMPNDTFKRIGIAANPPDERRADNYFWDFQVENRIDRTVPNIEQMAPGIDQEDVQGNAPVQITFSMPMWGGTLGDVQIDEYGLPAPTAGQTAPDALWFRPRIATQNNKTVVTMEHRVFGPNNQNAYYFTRIPSTVKAVNQNCVYPGSGPNGPRGTAPQCSCTTDQITGVTQCNANCVPVTVDRLRDTGCVQSVSTNDLIQPDVQTCINRLQQLSPTP